MQNDIITITVVKNMVSIPYSKLVNAVKMDCVNVHGFQFLRQDGDNMIYSITPKDNTELPDVVEIIILKTY